MVKTNCEMLYSFADRLKNQCRHVLRLSVRHTPHKLVVAIAAIERVVPWSAIKTIIAQSADQFIVASQSGELVVTGIACNCVVRGVTRAIN